MPIEVLMPKLSPTMENGQLVEWKVKVGDTIREGDVLADVETDKASMPMKAFDEGVVAHLAVQPGDEVALNQLVMVLAKKGEDAKEVGAKYAGGGKAAPAATKSAPAGKVEPSTSAAKTRGGAQAPVQEPHGRSESEAESYGDIGDEDDIGGESSNTPNTPEVSTGENGQGEFHYEHPDTSGRVRSTPLARKVAASAGVDIRRVKPSGPGGRVIRSDVDAFIQSAKQAPAKGTPAPAAAAAARPGAGSVEKVALTRMRKTIAARMSEAKRSAPDIHLSVDVRVDALVAVRETLNKRLAAEKIKLSVGDFVTKAVATALRRHPDVNATFEGDAIHRHGDVNIGLAVALDGGLIVPVLRNADQLGLKEIRLASEALYTAARQSKLSGDQLEGGTFTISNLGMYGIREFDAILNLPQVGILAVGAAEKRPVVEGDTLAIGTVMTITMTADHRALDGAAAAVFVQTLKGLLEEPATMLL